MTESVVYVCETCGMTSPHAEVIRRCEEMHIRVEELELHELEFEREREVPKRIHLSWVRGSKRGIITYVYDYSRPAEDG